MEKTRSGGSLSGELVRVIRRYGCRTKIGKNTREKSSSGDALFRLFRSIQQYVFQGYKRRTGSNRPEFSSPRSGLGVSTHTTAGEERRKNLVFEDAHGRLKFSKPEGTTVDFVDKPIWRCQSQGPIKIKGHLLNANLGGPGMIENLFPITSDANTAHSHLVEEPIKANFLTLSKHLGLLGGLAGVALPATADRLHYEVDAVWNQAGTGDFLNNPDSQFDCRAEFVDAANNSLAQLINTTIVSDPGTPPANTQNTDLNSIGWGSFGAGKRAAPNRFTTHIIGVAPGGGNQWIIQGPQWDNTNTPIGQKVYITCI